MRITVGRIRLGGEHTKSKTLAAPMFVGDSGLSEASVRIVGIEEGRAWMKEIRAQIHAMAGTVIGNGKAYLPSPKDLRNKNVTRWARGKTDMPGEYEPLVLHGVMAKLDLWYFLDCEACLEALGRIILEQKKLASLEWNVLNAIIDKRTVTYDVGESLALTTGTSSTRLGSLPSREDANDSSEGDSPFRNAVMLPLPHCDSPV